MAIEYALTRNEVVRAFFASLRVSARLRRVVLTYSVAIGLLELALRAVPRGTVGMKDALIALAWAAAAFFFMPAVLWFRGKKDTRKLAISQEGIATTIGRFNGQIPWKRIADIKDAGKFVLIVRSNGNTFFVPNRAFGGAEQRTQFLAEMRGWSEII
ncbi:MAG: YcxB family protein [Candidatus Angelobacter sp.]